MNYTPIDDLIKKHQKQNSVSLPKEAEPSISSTESYSIKEVVEHEPSEESAPFIEVKKESISLPPDLKKLGLQPVTTTQFPTYQNISLPLSDDKIVSGLHAPVTSSLRWLATLALYLLQKAHLSLRVVHGKVVRVLKR